MIATKLDFKFKTGNILIPVFIPIKMVGMCRPRLICIKTSSNNCLNAFY